MDTLDNDDDAPFLDISDTEVAVQLLLRDCPPGARTADDDVLSRCSIASTQL